MESNRGDNQKRGREIQLTVSHELHQGNSLNVAFWTLSKATETCNAENYNRKTGEREVHSRGSVKENTKSGSRSGVMISNLKSVVLLKEDTSTLKSQNTIKF